MPHFQFIHPYLATEECPGEDISEHSSE
ncbi:hypothetical protein VTN00DRAFT_2752 [Thermoascus crustaceus]